MARSRSRRRRRSYRVIVALVVTLVLVVLVRDVIHLSRQSSAQRTSLNRTFASLANSVVSDENALGLRLQATMSTASTLSRTQFAAALRNDLVQTDSIEQRANALSSPAVGGDVQRLLISVTSLRVTGVRSLVSSISRTLALPGPAHLAVSPAAMQSWFVSSNQIWRGARSTLVRQPGHARLEPSQFVLALGSLSNTLATVISVPSLAPTRALAIAAVSVDPAPLPAMTDVLSMIPITSLNIGVAVRNAKFVVQPFAVTVTIRPTTSLGKAVTDTVSGVIGPLGARAAAFTSLPVVPGERATVTITVTGAPMVANGPHYRAYALVVAPSPTH